ncbi:hypothetical protein [Actinopolymorpha singaporensis]|uniref:Uncharacterized protein n=1 Tax=Actinopolymorpha singaporensis TaxID=117157 RepID=A0A1H1LPD3_9ACTN|nr:hypothetical protein [Actinopolymorpha singaporensis]SDR76237.1 hypothetical protein SAMN04489717_0446 [Actinopolymorpha singaporensis]
MRTITAGALLLALAVAMGAVFMEQANRYVMLGGNQGCPRTVLEEMFNLKEGLYHQGEPRSDAQVTADKKTCLRAALPSMTVATTSMTGAVLLLAAGVTFLTRAKPWPRLLLLSATGVGVAVVIIVVMATQPG